VIRGTHSASSRKSRRMRKLSKQGKAAAHPAATPSGNTVGRPGVSGGMKLRALVLSVAGAAALGALLLGPTSAVRADASIPHLRSLSALTGRVLSLTDPVADHSTSRPAPGTSLHLTPSTPADAEYTLPEEAISSSDLAEPLNARSGRFCKVPRYLVPIYERAARDYRIPVRYLAANGAYESRFDSHLLGDSGRSCGIHQFHHFRKLAGQRDWSLWGFGSLERCQDPEANIRTVARVWRERMDNVDANYRCNGLLSCAVRLHKGQGAVGYMQTVMGAADRYYAPTSKPTASSAS
jgi:hypothetical protein